MCEAGCKGLSMAHAAQVARAHGLKQLGAEGVIRKCREKTGKNCGRRVDVEL